MRTLRRDYWSDPAKRRRLAMTFVAVATIGGWTTQQVAADEPLSAQSRALAAVPKADVPHDPVEAVFAFRDALDRVHWQLGFEPAARNAEEMAAGCRDVVAQAPVFMAALDGVDDAVASALRRAAAPAVALCASPGQPNEAAALAGYPEFRERSFDLLS